VGNYIFTAYASTNDTILDNDFFGFEVDGGSGKPGYGGNQLASSGRGMEPWKVLSGWFGYNEGNEGNSRGGGVPAPLPKAYALSQNFPNPFNPSTTIQYDVPKGESSTPVDVSIYDMRGRLVRRLVNEERTPGRHQIHWDGRDDQGQRVSSGVYLYKIVAGSFLSTKKMIMVR